MQFFNEEFSSLEGGSTKKLLIYLNLLINFFIDKKFRLSYKKLTLIINLNLYTFLKEDREDHES